LPKAEIHFNGVQPFVPVSWIPSEGTAAGSGGSVPISLLKVGFHNYIKNLFTVNTVQT